MASFLRLLQFSLGLLPLGGLAQNTAVPWAPYHAQPLAEQLRLVRTGNAMAWPVVGRQISFRQFDRMTFRDESSVRNLVLASNVLTIQLPIEAMESWVPVADPSGRYGFELTHKFDATARAGITAVRNSSFLHDLDAPSWNAYLGSLGSRPNARLVTNDDSKTNPNVLLILGGRTRVLEYRYSGEEPEDSVRSVLQVFSDLANGPLVIFTLECDSVVVPEVGPDFERLVDSFDFAEAN